MFHKNFMKRKIKERLAIPGKPFHLPFMPIGTVKRAAVHNRTKGDVLNLIFLICHCITGYQFQAKSAFH